MKPQLVALALGLIPISVWAATPRTGDGPAMCVIGHQFKPGPIVNGRSRQPTPREFEARMRELRAHPCCVGQSSIVAFLGCSAA
jgi:hypothetical protein